MGGRAFDGGGGEFTNPFEYDPVSNTWTTKTATYPDDDVNDMACGILNDSGSDYIYCVGGSQSGTNAVTGRVFRYEPIADVITTVAGGDWPPGVNTLPGGFTVFSNKLYILGGFDNPPTGNSTDQIWEFTPTTNAWVQKSTVLPVPLSYIPTTNIGSLIYTGGGADITAGTLTDETNSFVYDPVADSISTIADIPRATSNTLGLNLCGQMYVLGGAFNAISNELDIYDPVSNTWSVGQPFVTARRNFAADTDGTNNIWIAGGYDSNVAPTDSLEIFNCPVSPCGSPSPTPTATATATATATPTATATATPTATFTATPTPTATATATPTATATATATPIATATATATATPTATATATPIATATATPTATFTFTPTPTPTATATPTPTATVTATPTATATCTPTPIVISGSIETGDPMQTDRLSRSDIPQTCPASTTCAIFGDPTPHRYDAYTFTNTTGSTQCVTIDTNTPCTGNQFIFIAAYLGSFDPSNICNNWIGDAGFSPNPDQAFQVDVDEGQTLVVVVSEVNHSGCPGYTVTITGLCGGGGGTPTPTPCTGRCSPTPRPRPMPGARPTPPPHLTPVPPPPSPRPTPVPRPTPPPHITPVPSPTSPRPTPAPRP